ncbi:MAG: MBL fold metallo-hydrolase [Chloroflexi bacterium]|nr:MBL fold metallo-hydrolase [Chloroflexota bacterium]
MIEHIHWLGHASFRIEGPPCIYIDPWRIPDGAPPADVILISHEHYDHCSVRDIEKLSQPHTRIITGIGAARLLRREFDVEVLRAWQSVNVDQANIKALPAYTFDEYHPPHRGDVGFMISMRFYDIYYAGDTDFIPELARLGCDVAILPVSGKEGTMTIDAAKQLVRAMRPSYVIPSHYGSVDGGTKLDAKALETALQDEVKFLWREALTP